MCKLEFGGVAQRLERFLVKEEVARSNRVAPAQMTEKTNKPTEDESADPDRFAANIIEEGIKRKQEKTGKTREEIIEEAISESELVQSDEIHKKALEIAKKKK
ncbi:MAG: hypothetical protein UU32_C0029G0006 [Candidatus Woesebacteria bacterium GW2011_GWB1_41_10]|uniref:Uncharacterized protein n=1 Tax=Candidatus Woesebacteria bacterium GW2011_GWB1_41_10 TaxID=1618577 RepID=A0A0G0XDR3_9BACT|nr:MAG: hypothetical protein UU32_C0029G0006 [Candidatus Woesebacteria bacterium GW2011_GWB1_41_10]